MGGQLKGWPIKLVFAHMDKLHPPKMGQKTGEESVAPLLHYATICSKRTSTSPTYQQ